MVVTVSLVSALGTVDLNSDGVDVCRRQKLTWKPQFQVPFPHLSCSSRWVRARPSYHRVLLSSVSFPPSFLFPSRVRALRLSLSLETAFPGLGAGPEKQWLECGQRRAENWSLILSSAQQLSLCPPRAATMLKRKASYLQQLAREKRLNNHVSELRSPHVYVLYQTLAVQLCCIH